MKKNPGLIFVLLLISILLAGCQGGETEVAAPSSTPPHGSVMETITIYSINSDTMSLLPVSVKKPKKKLDGATVTALVTDNLREMDIRITNVVHKGKKLFISFAADSKPLVSCNKSMEKLILDCLSNSILDNVDNCEQVIFQRDGKAYQSEHRSFGIREVYASK